MKSEYKNPPYLYHYSSIETLALILKNKTIRFNRLDLVDDPEECETKDFGKIGRFFFVSCWMSDEEESIPMWKMYSNDLKGVRVKLPTFPFKKYLINNSNTKRQNSDANTTIHDEDLSEPFYSFINFENFQEFSVTTIPLQENILKKIEYTERSFFKRLY